MVSINDTIQVDPPLVNSSCAWSSEYEQLLVLYESPHTGAVTTRTATTRGFEENDHHGVWFSADGNSLSTINTYGYSPHPLHQYLQWVETIIHDHPTSTKPIIISIPVCDLHDFRSMLSNIQQLRAGSSTLTSRIAIEVNTSCPNIPGAPPPGYDLSSIKDLLWEITESYRNDNTFTVGLKLPPFTEEEHFDQVSKTLIELSNANLHISERHKPRSPISFLSCTNTLGGQTLDSVLIEANGDSNSSTRSTRSGGLGGEAMHEVALKTVSGLKGILSNNRARNEGFSHIKIIGIGGVTSKAAANRMKEAGADIVGCATFFGKEGVKAFEILNAREAKEVYWN